MKSDGRFKSTAPGEYFRSRYVVDEKTGCWNWTGTVFVKSGYGVFKCREIRKNGLNASRASWMLHYGDPGKKFVCHMCDNRLCVNPDHLFLGSAKDNMQDCSAKGRMNKGADRPQSKLTDDKVALMRSMRRDGFTYSALARMFKVSRSGAFNAVNVGWGHVD